MKKLTAVLTLMTIALCLAGSAIASTVKYDYDRDIDFSKWKLMAWRPAGPDAGMTEKRLSKAVESGFVGRGYQLVEDPAQADFLFDWRAAAWQDVRLQESFHGPAFGRDVSLSREAMGALVVTVYDRRTGNVAWRGMVADALASNPKQADQKTAKAVKKLLDKFPARTSP